VTRVCVMTAVFGGYDSPRPFRAQDIACDAILIADEPMVVPGWRTVAAARPWGASPRMAAKEPRCLPHRWTDADIVIWIDGHIEVISESFVRELVAQLDGGALGMFRHAFHTTISEEAALASRLPKYVTYDLVAQANHYIADGHPDAWGMWATGVMIRRPAETVSFGEAWLEEIKRWGPEDQISLPYVLRRTIGYPVDLPFEGWRKGYRFKLHQHNDGTD